MWRQRRRHPRRRPQRTYLVSDSIFARTYFFAVRDQWRRSRDKTYSTLSLRPYLSYLWSRHDTAAATAPALAKLEKSQRVVPLEMCFVVVKEFAPKGRVRGLVSFSLSPDIQTAEMELVTREGDRFVLFVAFATNQCTNRNKCLLWVFGWQQMGCSNWMWEKWFSILFTFKWLVISLTVMLIGTYFACCILNSYRDGCHIFK